MFFKKKVISLILIVCFCFAAAGCEATLNQVEKTDNWIKENMW